MRAYMYMFFMSQEPVSTATHVYSCRDYKGDRVVSLRWKHNKKRSKLKQNIPLVVKKRFAISMSSKLVIIYKKRTYIVEQAFVVMCPCHAGKLCILQRVWQLFLTIHLHKLRTKLYPVCQSLYTPTFRITCTCLGDIF